MKNKDIPVNGVNPTLVEEAKTDKEMDLAIRASGITIREHFTGLAMQALITSTVVSSYTNAEQAKIAINMADALLKELEK